MAPICEICREQDSKYKCPICELRYCSLVCYKAHKPTHENDTNEKGSEQPARQLRDRPGTTQRIPKVDFTGFEKDPEFQRLLIRYPLLKFQLQSIFALTLEPGPDDARSWNRQPLPGFAMPKYYIRGGRGRGRGRGRGDYGSRGGRNTQDASMLERERGAWTPAKGENEALTVMKKMRTGENPNEDVTEGMKEFIELCRIKFGEDFDAA